MVKDPWDVASIREDIEKRFYSAKIGKIVKLATNGKYDDALLAIQRLDSVGPMPELTQRTLYEEVHSLAVMDGKTLPENPYIPPHWNTKKKSAPKTKKKSAKKRKKKRHKGKR